MTLILGIDFGTTSIKVSCVQFDNDENYQILQRVSLAYQNHLKTDEFKRLNENQLNDLINESEMNPFLILSTLHYCLEQLSIELRNRISAVSVCGQMHGVIYWNK